MAGRGERGEGAEHGSELEENPFVGWEGREHNVTQRTPTGQRETAPRLIWGCLQSSSCSFPGDLPKTVVVEPEGKELLACRGDSASFCPPSLCSGEIPLRFPCGWFQN